MASFELGEVHRRALRPFGPDELQFTIRNPSKERLLVRYRIFGYDSKAQRISEYRETIMIRSGEAVVQKAELYGYGGPLDKTPKAKRILLEAAVEY